MSTTGLPVFDETLHLTNIWLKDLGDLLDSDDRSLAYRALREPLHILRDRLPVNVAAALAAQLPLLLRGAYYEGWRPAATPTNVRHTGEFVAQIRQAFRDTPANEPERIVRAVFSLLSARVSPGEIENVKKCLPEELRHLWASV